MKDRKRTVEKMRKLLRIFRLTSALAVIAYCGCRRLTFCRQGRGDARTVRQQRDCPGAWGKEGVERSKKHYECPWACGPPKGMKITCVVVPAKAGTQFQWIPASAGMT